MRVKRARPTRVISPIARHFRKRVFISRSRVDFFFSTLNEILDQIQSNAPRQGVDIEEWIDPYFSNKNGSIRSHRARSVFRSRSQH